jgi:hypothetical protein
MGTLNSLLCYNQYYNNISEECIYEIYVDIKDSPNDIIIVLNNKYVIKKMKNIIIYKLHILSILLDKDVVITIIKKLLEIEIISQNNIYSNNFNMNSTILECKYDVLNSIYYKKEEIDIVNDKIKKLFYLDDSEFKNDFLDDDDYDDNNIIKNEFRNGFKKILLDDNIIKNDDTLRDSSHTEIIKVFNWYRLLIIYTLLTTYRHIYIRYSYVMVPQINYYNLSNKTYYDLIDVLSDKESSHDILMKNSNNIKYIKIISKIDNSNISNIIFLNSNYVS